MDEVAVRKTGKQVDSLVKGLIGAADDRNKTVQASVSDAIFKVGKKHVNMVLSSCLNYLIANLKTLSQDHRIAILVVMERIVVEMIEDIEVDIAKELIKQAASEMISSKEVIPEWQTAASNLLVAAGQKYTNKVMEELTLHFQPGVLPHFFVVQTMGKLAIANPYGMVPFINVVLGTMLPMLGMAKHENMRWVFSYTLSKFAESIVYYVENIDQAPDKNVTIQVFSNEFFSAYDMLFNFWLPQAKDNKLRIAVIRAVGQISYIINPDKLTEQLPKLLSGIINLYKKQTELLPITESLCMVLDAATKSETRTLDAQLESLMNQLHSLICQPIDYADNDQVKNQNELLRCFAMLNRSYSDKVVANLLLRLEQKDEKTRIGSLHIIRHLVNSGGPQMEVKKALVISGLRLLIQEPSLKVRKVFAQTIIAMAHHGYLELEGGELMVEFIIKQCALPETAPVKKSADPDSVSPSALRSMCESVLQLVTTTIDIMEGVLWPYLLEFLIPVQYTEAFGVVCKNLAELGERKKQADDADYLIDYEDETNLPSGEALIARLFVMAGAPQNGRKRGENVLRAMNALVRNLQEELVTVWEEVVPKLLAKLEEMEDDDEFNQKKWDDLLLRLLSTSLNTVDDEKWIIDLGQSFGLQIDLYKDYPAEKNFCFKCIGVVMRKATQKEFLLSHMDLMFQKINHHNPIEQEGLAVGMGFTAAAHFDMVLTKLEQMIKNDGAKKSGGIIGFLKDKVATDNTENIHSKQTVMLSYGYVTLYAPITLVTSRIEAVVLRNINPSFAVQKDPLLKKNLINTVELIAKSLDPLHLQKQHELTQRPELINYLLTCVRQESSERLTGRLRISAFNASAALVKLDPVMLDADLFDLVKTCLTSVLALPADGAKKGKTESYEEQVELEDLMSNTLISLNNLLQEILQKDFTSRGLNTIIKHLVPWIVSLKDHERERSMTIIQSLLKYYLDHIESIDRSGVFTVLGEVIGRMVPRCTDPTIKVREEAILTIQSTLRIQLAYTGVMPETADKMVDALPILKDRLQKSDPAVLFSAVNDLSKVIAKKFPTGDQLISLVDVLMEGLADSQSLCSNGACVVLNGIAKLRGAELELKISDFLEKLHSKLPYVAIEQTKTGALRCVKSLAGHHLNTVLQALLKYPLPYDSTIVEFWQVLAKEAQLTDQVLITFLEMLKQNMPYEERVSTVDKKRMDRVATIIPLSIIMALKHMLATPEAKETVNKHFHTLFSAILLKIGSYNGARVPDIKRDNSEQAGAGDNSPKSKQKQPKVKPVKQVTIVPIDESTGAMRALFELTESSEMLDRLNDTNTWAKLVSSEEYVAGIEFIARSLAECHQSNISSIIECLSPALSNLYDTDRIVITAFFGQLIQSRCGGELTLVDVLVGSLMGRLVDSCILVRMLCVKGLGNIADTGSDMVQKYSTTVLSAMMSGMDDKDDVDDMVTREAMNGLSKILTLISESHIRPILINISLKIRPCFEKDQASVRAAAFELFGNLSKFGNGPSASPFLEQINSNLTAILLHLNDRENQVVTACKHTLKLIGPLLNSEDLNEMFQKYLIDSAHLHYGEFMNDLCKVIVADFRDKVPFYVMSNVTFFKSQWAEIRSNSALYLGFLMSALPESAHNLISQDHICSALLNLLKDPDSDVRCKAAEAMSLLSSY